jgi:peptidoglycan L-alanyl-D-glutamate endopeptidase CwlK
MPVFGSVSKANLAKCHPKLQSVLKEAIKEIDFKVLDSTRGRHAQERAFATGKSKARFGQSAHNYVPAIAVDLFPAPYDWNNRAAFKALAVVIMRIANKQGHPLRWGGDWNQDGDKTTSDAWDMPHFELSPWRTWAKTSKLYEDG